MRWVDSHDVDQAAPQLGLPGQVVVEIGGVAVKPVRQQRRPLAGVGGEQPGQPAGHRVAATRPQFLLVDSGTEMPEVGGQGGAPRCVQVGVDDLQQRPCHGVR